MNQKLLNFIKLLSENDKKTLTQKALKTTEEVGELAKAVLPYENAAGTLHRFVQKNEILENAVDTILCALSIAYDLKYTDQEIEEMMHEKATKWSGLQIKEDKVKFPLPYEIHITIKHPTEIKYFTDWCEKWNLKFDHKIKPIILDLENNDTVVMVDVMTSSVHYGDNNSAISMAKTIAENLEAEHFTVLRIKIETVPWHPAAPSIISKVSEMPKNCYFESHLRVVTTKQQKPVLKNIAQWHGAYISRNFFKKINNDDYIIMITLRNYKTHTESFKEDVEKLKSHIENNGFMVDKTEIEFAVYDTNTAHDSSWILKNKSNG